MAEERIVAVHVGLIRRPRRFAVQRKNSAGRDSYEVFIPQTLKEYVVQLLTVLNGVHPDFMARLAQLDDKQWMKSKHKTRRYVAEHRDHVYINTEWLTDQHTEKVLGYWVATNIGRKEAWAIIGLACEAAGVRQESIYRLQL
jgi:hypothetical protein